MLGVFLMAIVVCGVASFPKLEASLPQMGCADCKKYVGQVKNYHETATKQKVEARIALCKAFPELADECTDIVTKYFDEIYDFINTNFNSDEICSLAGLCDETNVHEPQVRSANDFNLEKYNDNGFGCDFCQLIAKYDVDLIRKNLTDELVKDFLLSNCKHLGIDEHKCDDFVNDNFEALLEKILKKSDPKTICTVMRLCGETNVYKPKKRPAIDINLEKNNVADCGYCQQIVQYVKGYLAASMTDVQFKQMLSGICANTGVYQPICDDFVNNNVDAQLIIISDTKAICTAVDLCVQSNVYKPKKRSVIDCNLGDCNYCEQIVHYVKGYIATSMTEEQFKQILLGACTNTGVYQPLCDDFVNNNVDMAYNYIVNQLDPKAICAAIDLRDRTKKRSEIDFNREKNNGENCIVCETAMQHVIDLTDTSTEDDVKNLIYGHGVNDCKLYGKLEQECNDLVNNNVRVAFNLITEKATPREICRAIRLCDQIPVPAYHKLHDIKAPLFTCNLCKVALQTIRNMLNNNNTEENIKHVIETVCDVLPKISITEECKDFIETYRDAILILIGHEIDPTLGCVAIDLCDSVEAPVDIQLPARLTGAETNVKTSECVICKTVIGVIHIILQDNKTEEAVEHALDLVCDYFPQRYQADCESFIDEYVEQLIGLVVNNDPDTICATLDLCSASKKTVAKPTSTRQR